MLGPAKLRRALLLAVLALMAVGVASQPERRRECERSDMCSLGKQPKRWKGAIDTGAGLRAMLETVNWKKEVIVSALENPDGKHMLQVLLLIQEIRYHGYGHFVLLTRSQATCDTLEKWAQDVHCAWDASPQSPTAWKLTFEAVWHIKWRFLARVPRLGYNVLVLDNDAFIFSDPYVHLKKHPQLQESHFFCLPEGGPITNCNGGTLYAQNVASDGPVAWAMRWSAEMPLRWMDDENHSYVLQNFYFNDTKMYSDQHGKCLCTTFDQHLMEDGLVSAGVGRHVTPAAFMPWDCMQDKWNTTLADGTTLTADQVRSNIERLRQPFLLPVTHQTIEPQTPEWTPELLKAMPKYIHHAERIDLTVPNANWGVEPLLGKWLYNDKVIGSYTALFHRQLHEDCEGVPGCKWWQEDRPLPPDHDKIMPACMKDQWSRCPPRPFWDNSTVPKEKFSQFPPWISHTTSSYRHALIVAPAAAQDRSLPAVIDHIHAWHLLEPGTQQKLNPRKLYGRFNWTLGEQFFAEQGSSVYSSVHNQPYSTYTGAPVTKVLALHPHLDLSRVRSWTELSRILAGLIQAALLTHRTPVLPDLPCESWWLHQAKWSKLDGNKTGSGRECEPPVLVNEGRYWFPNPIPYPVDDDNVILGGWTQGFSEGPSPKQTVTGKQRVMMGLPYMWDTRCTRSLHGLTVPELHHWLTTPTAAGAQMQPGPNNTAFQLPPDSPDPGLVLTPPTGPGRDSRGADAQGLVKPQADKGWSLADVQVSIQAHQVVRELRQFSDAPLVYMAHPVAVMPSADSEKHSQVNTQLANIMLRMRGSKCKAIWTFPEDVGQEREFFHLTDMVDLSSTQKGFLNKAHRIQLQHHLLGMTQLQQQAGKQPAGGGTVSGHRKLGT